MGERFGVNSRVVGTVPPSTLVKVRAAIATLPDEQRQLIAERLNTITRDSVGNSDLADRSLRLLEGKVRPDEDVRFDAVYELGRIETNFGRNPRKLSPLHRIVEDYKQELRKMIPDYYARMPGETGAEAESGTAAADDDVGEAPLGEFFKDAVVTERTGFLTAPKAVKRLRDLVRRSARAGVERSDTRD